MKNRVPSVVALLLISGLIPLSVAGRTALGKANPRFGVNLVVNGDAEAGPGSPDDGPKLMPIPGWTRRGVFQVLQYGAQGGFPDRKSPGPVNRGKNFFVGGPGSKDDQTSASQVIDVNPLSATIKRDKSHYSFSACLGGYGTQGDTAYVTASFQDGNGQVLAIAKIGPVSPAERKGKTGLSLRTKSGLTPSRTTRIVVMMVSNRVDGPYHDGSIDNVVLKLSANETATTIGQ
jgi:hypothetical protein